MSERGEQRLEGILGAIDSILRHQPNDLPQLLDDEPLQSHVQLKLQIIGEAASRLPETVRDQASEIPWRKIIGMPRIDALLQELRRPSPDPE